MKKEEDSMLSVDGREIVALRIVSRWKTNGPIARGLVIRSA